MILTRWTLAGLPALTAVLGFSTYLLVGFATDSWHEHQESRAATGLQRAHQQLTDRLDLIPLVTVQGDGQEVLNGLRDFCAVYRREQDALAQAAEQLPLIRDRLLRATGLMEIRCGAPVPLTDKSSPAEISQISLEFRAANRQAVLELHAALNEFGQLRSKTPAGNPWSRLLELLTLMALSGYGLFYLARRSRAGVNRPGSAGAGAGAGAGGPALSGQWIRTAMETASEGILIVEPEGLIRSANAAAERILGFERGQLVGLEASRIAPSLSASAESYGVLERVTVKSDAGVENHCHVSWFRRKGVPGAPIVVFVQSLPTVEVAAEAASAQKPRPVYAPAPGPVELEADSLERLENEILLVAGFGDVALASLPPESPAREELEQLLRAAARAVVLCREAAPASTAGAPSEPLRLNAFVAGFEQQLLALLEPGIDLMVRTDVAAGSVKVSTSLLEQAMLSLTLRALALVPDAKLIRLATAPGRIEAAIQTRGVTSPGWRRVLGDQNLPRAAAWLAAQGATLEQDVADNDGGFRFRIHMAPVAEPVRTAHPAADVA